MNVDSVEWRDATSKRTPKHPNPCCALESILFDADKCLLKRKIDIIRNHTKHTHAWWRFPYRQYVLGEPIHKNTLANAHAMAWREKGWEPHVWTEKNTSHMLWVVLWVSMLVCGSLFSLSPFFYSSIFIIFDIYIYIHICMNYTWIYL